MMKINKETIQKLNPLFQAIAEGKAIQVKSGDGLEGYRFWRGRSKCFCAHNVSRMLPH